MVRILKNNSHSSLLNISRLSIILFKNAIIFFSVFEIRTVETPGHTEIIIINNYHMHY